MNPAAVMFALVMAFTVGVIVGAGFYEVILRRAAMLTRNRGRSQAETEGRTFLPGGETQVEGLAPSLEQQDADRAKRRIVERGADDYQERFPELTRKDAIKRAEYALDSAGAFRPMGGIPGV